MDIYTLFNKKNIQDRQIDTLIGLSKGLVADGKINQAEAEFLMSWLVQNFQASNNPVIINLLDIVSSMLEDGVLDAEESAELLALLRKIGGASSEIGELAKTTDLPVDDPEPPIIFPSRQFLFTGTFAYGTRRQCHELNERCGGLNAKSVTKNLDYLVLGSYVTASWAHENFGRKIEKAMEYRDSGNPLVIVTESHWLEQSERYSNHG